MVTGMGNSFKNVLILSPHRDQSVCMTSMVGSTGKQLVNHRELGR
jgi:hypothetical protein